MLIKPIRWVLEMAGVADLLNIHMPAIGNYLDTGWGTLTSVAVGALIISSAIFFHERRVGNNTDKTRQPNNLSVSAMNATPALTPKITVIANKKPVVPAITGREQPIDYSRLYSVEEGNAAVWLKFLPDTKSECKNSDAFMLILYGYKVFKEKDEVPVHLASMAVRKSNLQPKKKIQTLMDKMMAPSHLYAPLPEPIDVDELWRECGTSFVEKLGLARGGFYKLTQEGYDYAADLAIDLIERA